MKKRHSTLPHLALILPSGVALSFYGYLGSFTRFIADDYCSVTYAQERGLLRSIWYWYHTWSGRYTAFGVDWLVLTKLLGRYSIQIVPPLILLIWLVTASAAFNLSLKSLAPERNHLLPAIALGMSLVFVILTLSPNVPQSLYWWNGMRSYTLPLVILTFAAFLFQLASKQIQTRKHLILWGILSFSLLFANGGLSETYVVLQLALLVFLVFLKVISAPRKKADPELILLLAGLLGTILSLIVIIAAPGNAVRQSRLETSFNLTSLVSVSLSGYGGSLSAFVSQPDKLAGLLGLIALSTWIGMQYKNAAPQPWKIFAYFIGGFLLSFACIVPGVYGYSELPPTRTLIIPVFILMVCTLQASFLAGSWLSNRISLSTRGMNGFIALACALMIFSTASTSLSLYGGRNAYIRFAKKWDRVDAKILRAKANGRDSVEIPSMANWSGLDRPNQDSGFWLNECYSDLYGIEVLGPPFLWE